MVPLHSKQTGDYCLLGIIIIKCCDVGERRGFEATCKAAANDNILVQALVEILLSCLSSSEMRTFSTSMELETAVVIFFSG